MCQEKLNNIDPAVIKAVGAFGGGLAGTGGVCGILLGGLTVISSMYSRSNLEEKENPRMWSLSQKLIATFEEITHHHGGTNCLDIARVNWHNHAEVKDFYENPNSTRHDCIKLVGAVTFILGELIESEVKKGHIKC